MERNLKLSQKTRSCVKRKAWLDSDMQPTVQFSAYSFGMFIYVQVKSFSLVVTSS